MPLPRALPPVVLLLVACGGDATSVALRYRPATGATYTYVMSQTLKMSGDGETTQEMTMRMGFTQTVKGPSGEGIELAVRIDSASIASPQAPAEALAAAAQRLHGLEARVVLDERMQTLTTSVAEAGGVPPQIAQLIASTLRGATLPLPPGTVRVGESWKVTLPAPAGQALGLARPLMLTMDLRLTGLRVSGADTTAQISVSLTYPTEPVEIGDGSSVRFDGKMQGEQEYSITRSAIVRLTLGGTLKVSTAGAGASGPGGTMSSEQHSTIELIGSQP